MSQLIQCHHPLPEWAQPPTPYHTPHKGHTSKICSLLSMFPHNTPIDPLSATSYLSGNILVSKHFIFMWFNLFHRPVEAASVWRQQKLVCEYIVFILCFINSAVIYIVNDILFLQSICPTCAAFKFKLAVIKHCAKHQACLLIWYPYKPTTFKGYRWILLYVGAGHLILHVQAI